MNGLRTWLAGRGIVGAALFAATASSQESGSPEEPEDSPIRLAVAQPRVALAAAAVPACDLGGELGELWQGTPVEVLEDGARSDGLVHVRIEGWLPRATLSDSLPVRPVGRERHGESRGAPVANLARAHHVAVRPELIVMERRRVVRLEVELETFDGRPIVVSGSRLPGRLGISPQRKIAGGHARGAELVAREFEFVDGRATIELPLAELGDPAPALAIFSVRAELGAGVELVGAAAAVALPAR